MLSILDETLPIGRTNEWDLQLWETYNWDSTVYEKNRIDLLLLSAWWKIMTQEVDPFTSKIFSAGIFSVSEDLGSEMWEVYVNGYEYNFMRGAHPPRISLFLDNFFSSLLKCCYNVFGILPPPKGCFW